MRYANEELSKSIVQLSRLKYGRDKEEIEVEITRGKIVDFSAKMWAHGACSSMVELTSYTRPV